MQVVACDSLNKAGTYAAQIRAALGLPREGLALGFGHRPQTGFTSNHGRIFKDPGSPTWGVFYDPTIAALGLPLPSGAAIQVIGISAWTREPLGADYLAVFDGNSLTAGFAMPAGYEYPALVGARLNQIGLVWDGPNLGIGGQTTAQMNAIAPTNCDPLFANWRIKNIVVAWEITNSLYFGATAAQTYADVIAFCTNRRAVGFDVIVGTCLPRNAFGQPPDFEANRLLVNAMIRANYRSFCRGIADIGASPLLQNTGDPIWYGDGTHLTADGYVVVGDIVFPSILAVL